MDGIYFLDFFMCQVTAGVLVSIRSSLVFLLQAVGRGLKHTLGFPGMANQSSVLGSRRHLAFGWL